MATLVQFLAAGVRGAESGSAEFFLRGTDTSAASVLYDDFEGTTQPGTNLFDLDSNGGMEIYCDAYVDVVVRSSAGTILRSVTVGNSAPLVEVQSTSFTGTDYDGDPSNTLGEPITLKAVLDKWITSAGSPDWQVLIDGVPTNLSTALAAAAGVFINVKDPTYGAEGDGVTDDTTAIAAACAAAATAGGGIVFFPVGTYQVEQLTLTNADIILMGCGDESSILRGTDASTYLLAFTDATAASSKRITGLGFAASAAYGAFVDFEASRSVSLDNCKFTCANISGPALRRADVGGLASITVENCVFQGVGGTAAIQNLAGAGAVSISVHASRFVVSSSFTGSVIDGPNFTIEQCDFDASDVATGSYYHIDCESNEAVGTYIGSFSGNLFINGSDDGYVFKLTNLSTESFFTEDNNTFVGFLAPETISDPGHIYDYSNSGDYDASNIIHLGSRKGKQLNFTNSTETSFGPFECFLVADTIVVDHTFAGNAGFFDDAAEKPLGLTWNMVVLNNSSGTRTLQFNGGGTGKSIVLTGITNGSMVFGSFFTFVESAGTVRSAAVAGV